MVISVTPYCLSSTTTSSIDHSLRIPRPDLTVGIDVPNACNRCHADKSAQWSVEQMTKWYGTGRAFHYGSVIAAGRRATPEARGGLIHLADDRLYPTIVRATALSLLTAYDGKEVIDRPRV